MAQTALVSPKVISDLVKHESSPAYNRESINVTTVTGVAVDIAEALGQPLKKIGAEFLLVAAADIANATALLLETDTLVMAANSDHKFLVLSLSAGAVINSSALPALDGAGAAINQTNFIAALVGVGFRVVSDPAETTTQTT